MSSNHHNFSYKEISDLIGNQEALPDSLVAWSISRNVRTKKVIKEGTKNILGDIAAGKHCLSDSDVTIEIRDHGRTSTVYGYRNDSVGVFLVLEYVHASVDEFLGNPDGDDEE